MRIGHPIVLALVAVVSACSSSSDGPGAPADSSSDTTASGPTDTALDSVTDAATETRPDTASDHDGGKDATSDGDTRVPSDALLDPEVSAFDAGDAPPPPDGAFDDATGVCSTADKIARWKSMVAAPIAAGVD